MQDAGDTMLRNKRRGICHLGSESLLGAADRILVGALLSGELQLQQALWRRDGAWTVRLTQSRIQRNFPERETLAEEIKVG